ncbi:carboxypeptidase-like regulatory domain-containing protein [Capnocytophaga sp.]|uniref:carboxypeptidase-like regulatory domain-containing protein n=1 Tax=Capnocytophaga sp. TaxID=44737 RepID=UPI0026DB3ED2|nr:carboxypeptidase-like regulatory domain-containing protein [Capnocytophaga sp.]MDO5105939.1 carboxypeptidase-like regulatory domain-containing protein [Capnocytophaga sp.]
MRKILSILAILFFHCITAQETEVQGTVFNVQTKKEMPNVHILNLNKVIGTTTDNNGNFTIRASVNDTLYLSFLGHKSMKVFVTNDMIRFTGTKIGMTELAYALEEVVITPYKLTGFLDIDAKNIPINENKRYSISNLEIGYESKASASAVGRVFSAIFNPADLLYRTFGSRGQEMKKLRKIRDDNKLSDALAQKYDRETLLELLQISRSELEDIIRSCNYSSDFIMSANDLQILEAISNCYEEYRVLNRKKK